MGFGLSVVKDKVNGLSYMNICDSCRGAAVTSVEPGHVGVLGLLARGNLALCLKFLLVWVGIHILYVKLYGV